MISVLPWLGMGDFATSEEAREASVAAAMLDSGNWTLPEVYAGDFSHNPPLQHWLIALFSLPKGEVTPFTSRLPSALAFFALIGLSLSFFGQRIRFQQAFISVLLLLSCVGLHFTAMIAGVYMLFTALVVIALYEMFKWEEKQSLKGLPPQIPLLLGGAILTKGLIGLFLPIIIFGIYLLLLRKQSLLRIFKALLYIFVSSLFLPSIWYFAAWRQGGDAFTQIIIAENYGIIFDYNYAKQFVDSVNPQKISYIGTSLLTGFMPWTILAVLSVFTLIGRRKKPIDHKRKNTPVMARLRKEEGKVKLLSIITIIVSLVIFSIPISKSSSYLLIAYPFIALFLAEYFIYLSTNKGFITRVFAAILSLFTAFGIVVVVLTMTDLLDPVAWISQHTNNQAIIEMVKNVDIISNMHKSLTITLLLLAAIASGTVFYQLFKRINIKIIYAIIFLAFSVNIFSDSVFIRGIRKGSSSKLFARMIQKEYPIQEDNIFVVYQPGTYMPLYGMNYYMNGTLRNFEENPGEGYLLSTSNDLQQFMSTQGSAYTFDILTSSRYYVRDSKAEITLSYFKQRE